MTIANLRELFLNWWYGGNFRSRAKDDYRKLAKLNLGIADIFPGEEDALFAQIDKENLKVEDAHGTGHN